MRSIKRSASFIILGFYCFISKSQTLLADSLFHPDTLRHIVEVLASDSLKGRYTGTIENLKAASFIANEFKRAGLHPIAGNDGFFHEIKPSWFNVIGAIQGHSKPGELIIFSAHYDHIGTIKTGRDLSIPIDARPGDDIYNGANDNASGVAAVISLAKYFNTLNNNERTLLFIAFTGEEQGLIGSQQLAEDFEADSIVAMINIEMIGRAEFRYSHPFISGYERSDLGSILNRNYRVFGGKNADKTFFKADPYPREFLFRRSDNYSFAVKGVPAHTIQMTAPDDRYYHTLSDEASTLDFGLMKKVINAIAISAAGLVNGIDTPRRIR